MNHKRLDAIKRLEEASQALNNIAVAHRERDINFFENKWEEQKARQLEEMIESKAEKRECLEIMLGLEEELVQARDRLKALQNKRRRARANAEKNELMSLPTSVADIEEQIEFMATALGGEEFHNLVGATRNQENAVLSLAIARGNLYEAKVGLVEARLRRHWHSARQQQYIARHLWKRTSDVCVKYNTYKRQVYKYVHNYPDANAPHLPELGQIMTMEMDDDFWNRGELEPEAGKEGEINRLGINSFLAQRSSREELRRIAREAHQMTAWANMYYDRIVSLKNRIEQAVGADRVRMLSLYNIVKKQASKLWKRWGFDLKKELEAMSTYINVDNELYLKMKDDFEKVTDWAEEEWRMMAGKPVIRAQEPDIYEEDEDLLYEQLYDNFGELRV
ncbi:uncharacterized protein MELLADRAFT_90589 [Melampsora larici-populina 98AG31]|uniref:Uncharacterized protein n=1 Tax=Melampsora larici-populina (strain 98AG31 / pathotype 3-4-7) TaxID=747676 RepID=F4RXG1_MELLP|nr:uncharacterized protein MELLADRAFT_90589 [Melampsora larici-populina 98AG31]EGG02994.1 hypothetical protein MELLADRAFT_90589 [Melampsora larici-populina 98AG31]